MWPLSSLWPPFFSLAAAVPGSGTTSGRCDLAVPPGSCSSTACSWPAHAARLWRRPAGPGARPGAGLAGVALRRPGLLRGQPDRRRRRHRADRLAPDGRGQQIPYGVFLAAGCAVAVFAGPGSCAPSLRILTEAIARGRARATQRTISIRSPCSSHSGSAGMRMAARAKMRRAVQTKAAASRRWARRRPGNSAARIALHPGKLRPPGVPGAPPARLGVLGLLQRLAVVHLVEADVRVHLVDRALPERRHLGRHLPVAGEQRPADGVEVVGRGTRARWWASAPVRSGWTSPVWARAGIAPRGRRSGHPRRPGRGSRRAR